MQKAPIDNNTMWVKRLGWPLGVPEQTLLLIASRLNTRTRAVQYVK